MTAVSTSAPATAEATLPLWERLSDRCNPILVRELQQTLKSRALTGAILLALLVLFGLAGTIGLLGNYDRDQSGHGREAFTASFGALLPFLTFLMPMQAFFSMMHEVRDGSAELLLMSRLTPRQIVRGKLQAAAVLFVLFLALFAPTMALTWLLRGVSITMILMSCALALLMALVSSSLAIAAGSLARSRQVTPLMIALVAVGLGGVTIGAIAGGVGMIESMERASLRELLVASGSTGLGLVATLWLFALVAQSQLTHQVENRATPFRIYFAIVALALGTWILVAADRSHWQVAFPFAGVAFNCFFAIPAVIMVTEEFALSPRVRQQVPRRFPWLAAPWLPGGQLGLLYVILLEAALALVVTGFQALGTPVMTTMFAASATCWFYGSTLYLVCYAAIGAWIRGRFAPGPARSWLSRTIVVTTFALLMLAPLLIQALLEHRVVGWNGLHIMNPFWTLDHYDHRAGSRWELYTALGGIAACLVLLNVKGIFEALGKVRLAARRPAQNKD